MKVGIKELFGIINFTMNRAKLKRKNVLDGKKKEKVDEQKSKEAETLSGYESDEVNLILKTFARVLNSFFIAEFPK